MPTQPIPFSPLNKSADKPGMTTFNQSQMDGYWQEYLSTNGPTMIWAKRPGKTLFCDLSESYPVDGLHYWVRQQQLIAVCNGKIFRVNSSGVRNDVTGTGTMKAAVRPTFADVLGTYLYLASSGKIAELPAASTATQLSDGQAPTTVRFIAVLNQVLVALRDTSEQFDWADAGTPTVWSGLYANVEGNPDLGKALHAANGYLYFHGQASIEAWRDDGESFVRESQGILQRGTAAPYSVMQINGEFFWLDNTREVVRLSGFTPAVISNPALSRYIKGFSTVSDAKGDYLKLEGRHFYVLSFPVEQKTLVFDIGLGQWYEWGYYNALTAEYDAWLGNCVADAFDWNRTLIGDRRTGKIWDMTGTTDDGATIRTMIRTDHIDRGTPDTWKTCHELILVFKRSDTSTTPKTMTIRWRDDGSTSWNIGLTVEVEATSKTELIVKARRLGRYKRSQWEFALSDASQSALIDTSERFDVGR